MPSPLPRFSSLPSQVAALVQKEIEGGAWGEWLPGERTLTELLQVSRKTLRKALAQLQREGLVQAIHGLGNRIVALDGRSKRIAPSDPIIGLLTPEPLEQMRPYTSLWVNTLKNLLGENGVRLRTFSGRKYFSPHPARALEKLIDQQPANCWLLANSTESTQRWFMRQSVPCMISGSCHPGIDLPDVDLNQRALSRHAAGVLLRLGHRRIGLLHERAGRAGDLEGEGGFVAGVRDSGHKDAVPLVVTHEHDPAQLGSVLARLLELREPPTALLVSSPSGYLTVVSLLAERGLRVPHDISVISRDDEPFLDHLIPVPARYACHPGMFAKKLLKPLSQLLRGETIAPRHTRILPVFRQGGSVRPPRGVRASLPETSSRVRECR